MAIGTKTWLGAAWLGVMAIGVAISPCLATDNASAATPAELASFARAAVQEFRPLTSVDVQQARTDTLMAVATLVQRLRAAGENGQDWRKYLEVDVLETELRKPKPDLAVLERIATKRFAAGHAGLELRWFTAVRQTIERYVAISRGVEDPKLQEHYGKLLQSLAQHLEAFGQNPDPAGANRINADLRWLMTARQAPQLVEDILQSLQMPNAYADVSAETINAAIAADLNETMPVEDCILGTSITGTAHTVGQLRSQLVPNDQRALINTIFQGRTDSQTQGINGPAVICSQGVTCLLGSKLLAMTEEGLSASDASSCANTSSTTTGLCVNSPLRLVLRIASRRVEKQRPKADVIASQHAAYRLSGRMDRQGDEMIANNNQSYQDRIKEPLWERNLWPQLNFSTQPEALRVTAVEARPYQITAMASPPSPAQGTDLNIRVHESALNNMAVTALGGMLLRDEDVQTYAQRLLGYVPDDVKVDPNKEPWAIRFAAFQPITVNFEENAFRVTVHGDEFIRGGASYPAMNIMAAYKIVSEITSSGVNVKAVREKPIEVLPPRFEPGKGEQLSGREVAIRDLLKKRFDKIFPPEIASKDLILKPRSDWAKIGVFEPVFWASKAGWMNLAWHRTAAPSTPAVASSQ